jgi:hypothetical protein
MFGLQFYILRTPHQRYNMPRFAADNSSSTYLEIKVVFEGKRMACQTCSKMKVIQNNNSKLL